MDKACQSHMLKWARVLHLENQVVKLNMTVVRLLCLLPASRNSSSG